MPGLQIFHDLVPAVGAAGHLQIGAGGQDIPGLAAAVPGLLLLEVLRPFA